MQAEWNINKLLGFLASWSATPEFIEAIGHHPLELIIDEVQSVWGAVDNLRSKSWLMHLRIGKL